MLKQVREEFKTYSRPAQAAVLVLAAALLCHCVFLVWACLTQFPSHIDGDSSSQILKVMEIARVGSFSLRNWHDTTTMLWDTPLTLAAVLYPVFHSAFAAYGAGMVFLDAVLLIVTALLLREAGVPLWARLTALLMLLCPYGGAQGLGYANSLVVQSGHYTLKVLYLLLLLLAELRLCHGARGAGVWVPVGGVLFLSLLFGVSSGIFLLIMVTLPFLLFWGIWALLSRRYALLRSPAFLLVLASAFAMLAGRFVQNHILHFYSRESGIAWIGYNAFLTNLGHVLQGYLRLLDAMPADSTVPVLSTAGILYGVGLLVALALPAGAVLVLYRKRQSTAPAAPAAEPPVLTGSCLCLIAVDLIVFCGASLTYGETTYECRYLMFMTTAMILLLAFSLPDLPLQGDLRLAVPALLCLCVVLNVARCDAIYSVPTYDFSTAQAVSDALSEAYPQVRVVYMQSDDHDRKVLRVTDTDKVYRFITGTYNPGDYTYYQDGSGLENGSLLLCTAYQYKALEPAIRERFVRTDLPEFWLYFDKTGYSTNDPQPYAVYYCADGGIDLSSLPY